MSLTRNDLIKAVMRLGITESRANDAVDAFFDSIGGALQSGDKVTLTGFGVWEWRSSPPREARNPRTGEKVWLKARRVLTFRPSQQLKRKVNLKNDTRDG